MIEFLSAASRNSHEAIGVIAAGGGLGGGWVLKYVIDKLAERRNGGNGRISMARMETNQKHCLAMHRDTQETVERIDKNSTEQVVYLKLIYEAIKDYKR